MPNKPNRTYSQDEDVPFKEKKPEQLVNRAMFDIN